MLMPAAWTPTAWLRFASAAINLVRQRGKLRIIAGLWRGRRLPIANIEGLRPTPDRVRETLFNWLQQDIPGSVCVDLFAGSGALAFEALSRGARQVVAVEQNPQACEQMRQSAAELGTDRLQVVCADVGEFLRQSERPDLPDDPWQIVFMDPPYDLGYPPPQWPQLQGHVRLADNTLVYLESHSRFRDTPLADNAAPWTIQRQKVAGDVCYRLLQRCPVPRQE